MNSVIACTGMRLESISSQRHFVNMFINALGLHASQLKFWATTNPHVPVLTDANHQRAGGNLRYFEQLLFKQRNELNQDYQPASEEPIQLGTYTRPKDHLPEREIYEALCRGEGLQMVRRHKYRHVGNEVGCDGKTCGRQAVRILDLFIYIWRSVGILSR